MRKSSIFVGILVMLMGWAINLGLDIFPPYSLSWIAIQFVMFYISTTMTEYILKWLYTPVGGEIKTPVLDEVRAINGFEWAIKEEAKLNFMAISSKKIALWDSPSFLYYVNLNTIKSLKEYIQSEKNPLIEFHSSKEIQAEFFREGLKF